MKKSILNILSLIVIGILFWFLYILLIIKKIDPNYIGVAVIFIGQFFAIYLYGDKINYLKEKKRRIIFAFANSSIVTLLTVLNHKYNFVSTSTVVELICVIIYYIFIMMLITFLEQWEHKRKKR